MLGVALLSSALLALAHARVYERCELARDLLSYGVRREHLATWVCIAYHESNFNTAAYNPSSRDHGVLQISEIYWCGAGKGCGLPCSALRDDDISDDVKCALQIYKEHTRINGDGFLAWVVYPHHCKDNPKKYLADCESSLKLPIVRTDIRGNSLSPQIRNVTYESNYPKIDELLPPYLTIGSVFSGNYEKEFEQNYKNKVQIDWLNYKIDNIDELKLPVFNQKVITSAIGEYPTTTLATIRRRPIKTTTTTTTTTESPLPKIKPPNPRRIESNSFRRKKLRPLFNPVSFITTTYSPTILPSTTTPGNRYFTTTENVKKRQNLTHFEDNANITREESTVTTERSSSSKDQNYSTTKKNDPYNFYKSQTSSTTAKTTTKTTTTTTTTTWRPWTRSWSNWRTTSKYNNQTTTSTSKPSSPSRRTENTPSTTAAPTREDITLKVTKHPSTTTKSWVKTRPWFESKVPTTQPPKLLSSKNITASAKVLVESTTSKPPTTPTFYVRSTANAGKTSRTTTETTTRVTAKPTVTTTVRPTQSIFDLYLRPTKRPAIAPFSFSPFGNSGGLKIFSGGTTTLASILSRRDSPKSLVEESTKDQKKSPTWQKT